MTTYNYDHGEFAARMEAAIKPSKRAAPKRPNARARLLLHANGLNPPRWFKERTARLLRAHEAELAERALRAMGWALPMECARVHAAILGVPRPSGRGKKGATK